MRQVEIDARHGTAPRKPNEADGDRGSRASLLMAASSSGTAAHAEPDFTVDAYCHSIVGNLVPIRY